MFFAWNQVKDCFLGPSCEESHIRFHDLLPSVTPTFVSPFLYVPKTCAQERWDTYDSPALWGAIFVVSFISDWGMKAFFFSLKERVASLCFGKMKKARENGFGQGVLDRVRKLQTIPAHATPREWLLGSTPSGKLCTCSLSLSVPLFFPSVTLLLSLHTHILIYIFRFIYFLWSPHRMTTGSQIYKIITLFFFLPKWHKDLTIPRKGQVTFFRVAVPMRHLWKGGKKSSTKAVGIIFMGLG